MLHTTLKPAGNKSWEAWMETERGWEGRMSEKMLNKQECLQPPVGDCISTTAVWLIKDCERARGWVGAGRRDARTNT